MILPTIESFEYVTGDLDKIRLDVDVMTNRPELAKRILYGKDVAALMEHCGVRQFCLDGGSLRGFTFEPSLSEYWKFPAEFSRLIKAYKPSLYLPFEHSSWTYHERFYRQLKFCTGFPTLPDFSFTDAPIVTETTDDYVGEEFPTYKISILKKSQMLNNLNDMKLQQYGFYDFGGLWCDHSTSSRNFGDDIIEYDKHGTRSSMGRYAFSYRAMNDTNTGAADYWWIISGKPLTITYPTRHIVKAQLWMWLEHLAVNRNWYDRETEEQGDEGYDLGRFVFKMDESTNGTLTIDQMKILDNLKYAVTSSGHPWYDMGNVFTRSKGYGNFYLYQPPVQAMMVFEFDDHTKWWE